VHHADVLRCHQLLVTALAASGMLAGPPQSTSGVLVTWHYVY